MIKRAIPALIAVALVGWSDNKPAIGRFRVHESSVDEYFGTKTDPKLTPGLTHILIKIDTATGESWYWALAYVDGKVTRNREFNFFLDFDFSKLLQSLQKPALNHVFNTSRLRIDA
jgi:hypothetical protein